MKNSNQKFSKLLFVSISLNILMFSMLLGIAYHKRSGIKHRINDALLSIKYMNLNKSINSQKYDGELTPEKRYLAIGFDDFRDSDFDMVIPLFKKYGATATFNRIAWNADFSKEDLWRINQVFNNGNELGDHTFFHCNYIYTDALCNGQNPDFPEGEQVPFPSNEQLRNDCGNGKNAFGFDLDASVRSADYGYLGYEKLIPFDSAWKNLTDAECQFLRDFFSIYKDKSGKLALFDSLSNKYLGTTGSSYGSWHDEKACYTGGIFTGARTSCNHEIWERILKITDLLYKDKYNPDFSFSTWSWPGDPRSPFYFSKDGKFYYDSECTKLYNYLARFPSSIQGNERSWTDVITGGGYYLTHDTFYPSRLDGERRCMMSQQLIYNAHLSRKNALPYSTNCTVSYDAISKEYDYSYFSEKRKSAAAQMYDGKGSFYKIIEALRHDTANGLVHGEVIDSVNSYSERIFLEELLEYCKQTGVEVISKAKAYDICFNHPFESGNLIYNQKLKNTAKEFLLDSECVPSNPDGYIGNCEVIYSDGVPQLVTNGETVYVHYGIPLGNIRYSVNACGDGKIFIYAIKNSDSVDLNDEELTLLASLNVESKTMKSYSADFFISDNPETEYEQVCAGLGDKIMGIKLVYSQGLVLEGICLEKTDSTR